MIQLQTLWESDVTEHVVKNFQYVKAITMEYLIVFLSNNTFTVNFRSLVDDSTQTITFDFFKNKKLSEIRLNELGTHFYLLTEDGLFANIPIFIFSEEMIAESWQELVQADDPIQYIQSMQKSKEPKKRFSFATLGEYLFGKGEEYKGKKPFTFTLEDISIVDIRRQISDVYAYEFLNDELSFREKLDLAEDPIEVGAFQTFEKWINIYEEEYYLFTAKQGYMFFLKEDTPQVKVFQFPFDIATFKVIKSQKMSSLLLQSQSGKTYLVLLEHIAENRVNFLFENYPYSSFEPRRLESLSKTSLYFEQAYIREDTKFLQYKGESNSILTYTDGNIDAASELVHCNIPTPTHLIEWLQFYLVFYVFEEEVEIRLISKKALRYQVRHGLYTKEGKSPSNRTSAARRLKYLFAPFQDLESACIVSERIHFGDKIVNLKLDHSNIIRSQSQGSYDLSFLLATPSSLCNITISLKRLLDSNWSLLKETTLTKERYLITDYVLSDFYGNYTEKLEKLKERLRKEEAYNVLFDLEIYELFAFKESDLLHSELQQLLEKFLHEKQLHMRANIIHLLIERMQTFKQLSLEMVVEYAMFIYLAIFRDVIKTTYKDYFSLSFRESLSEELTRFADVLITSVNKLEATTISMKVVFRILELSQEKCINYKKGFINSYGGSEGQESNYELYFEKSRVKYSMINSSLTPYNNFARWLAKCVEAKRNYISLSFRALLYICEDCPQMKSWQVTMDVISKLDLSQIVSLLYNAIYKAKTLYYRSVHVFLSYLDRAFECLLASRNVPREDLDSSLELFSFYHETCTPKQLSLGFSEKRKPLDKVISKMFKFIEGFEDQHKKCDFVGVNYTFAALLRLHTVLASTDDTDNQHRVEEVVKKLIICMQNEIKNIDVEKLLYFCLSQDNEKAASLIISCIEQIV